MDNMPDFQASARPEWRSDNIRFAFHHGSGSSSRRNVCKRWILPECIQDDLHPHIARGMENRLMCRYTRHAACDRLHHFCVVGIEPGHLSSC